MKTTILSLFISLAGNPSEEAQAVKVLEAPKSRVEVSMPVVKGIQILTKEQLNRKAVEKVSNSDAEMAGFPKSNVLLENQLKAMELKDRFEEVQFKLVVDHLQTVYAQV